MRCAGTSSVVTASTSVDLPDPMSPVSRAFLPPGFSAHTRPAKVPQLKTSRRCKRKPDRASSAPKSSPGNCMSVIGTPVGGHGELRLIRGEPRIEIGQPLGVYEGFENALHLERRGLPIRLACNRLQPAQESQFHDPVDMR